MEERERIDPAILYSINLDWPDLLGETGRLIGCLLHLHMTSPRKSNVTAYAMQSDSGLFYPGRIYDIKAFGPVIRKSRFARLWWGLDRVVQNYIPVSLNTVGLMTHTMTKLVMIKAAVMAVIKKTLPLLAGNLPRMIQYYGSVRGVLAQ